MRIYRCTYCLPMRTSFLHASSGRIGSTETSLASSLGMPWRTLDGKIWNWRSSTDIWIIMIPSTNQKVTEMDTSWNTKMHVASETITKRYGFTRNFIANGHYIHVTWKTQGDNTGASPYPGCSRNEVIVCRLKMRCLFLVSNRNRRVRSEDFVKWERQLRLAKNCANARNFLLPAFVHLFIADQSLLWWLLDSYQQPWWR